MSQNLLWIAFCGQQAVATGTPKQLVTSVLHYLDQHPNAQILTFDAITSQPIDLDLRGNLDEILSRLGEEQEQTSVAPRPRGRPKLGVVAKEVTLLPRHWEWLASQPGSASVTLRKLVDSAMRQNSDKDQVRIQRESVYKFMHALAGNEPGFEEASRYLFRGDYNAFRLQVAKWPVDIAMHLEQLLSRCSDA